MLLIPARSLRIWQLFFWILALAALIGWQGVSSTSRLIEQQAVYQTALATPIEERSDKQSQALERWESRWSPKVAKVPGSESPRLAGYFSNLQANLSEVKLANGEIFYRGILFRTLLMMLTGILLYRLGIFHDFRKLKGYWIITMSVLAVGLVANYSRHWTWTYEYFSPVTDYGIALAHHFSKEILGVGYLLAWNGLHQACLCKLQFNPLASVGRMALSNYLFQSVLAGVIFYGYGLGLHGSLGRSELWPIILAVWALQLTLSVLWLRKFRQGPVEALWRRLMYASAMQR